MHSHMHSIHIYIYSSERILKIGYGLTKLETITKGKFLGLHTPNGNGGAGPRPRHIIDCKVFIGLIRNMANAKDELNRPVDGPYTLGRHLHAMYGRQQCPIAMVLVR